MTTARRRLDPDPRGGRTDAPDLSRLLGWLPDGTPRHAPIGQLLVDGDRVCCHLCGRWYLSVASHLRSHEWTKADYIAAFGLELGNPLSGDATHRRRSAALRARSRHEPAVRAAQEQARRRAHSGALTAAASLAARGRAHSAQRRPKTLAALTAIKPEARAEANARRAQAHRDRVARAAAALCGFADFTEFALDRIGSGTSLAAISREAGLHKDWVSRHLGDVAPRALTAWQHSRAGCTSGPGDRSWAPVLDRSGFGDLETFLRTRHLGQSRTVAEIAREAQRSRPAVVAAMARHGLTPIPHVAKRARAADRGVRVAGDAGFDSLADFICARRGRGDSWRSMAAEIGLPETTLRRHSRSNSPSAD